VILQHALFWVKTGFTICWMVLLNRDGTPVPPSPEKNNKLPWGCFIHLSKFRFVASL
jgi:hypothetical protein